MFYKRKLLYRKTVLLLRLFFYSDILVLEFRQKDKARAKMYSLIKGNLEPAHGINKRVIPNSAKNKYNSEAYGTLWIIKESTRWQGSLVS